MLFSKAKFVMYKNSLNFATCELILISYKEKKRARINCFQLFDLLVKRFYIIWSSDYTLSKDEKLTSPRWVACTPQSHCGWPDPVKSCLCNMIVLSK